MRVAERGVVLLEAMIALAVLTIGGTAAVMMVSAALQSETELARHEGRIRRAARLLAATTLLTRADLDRRLGTRDAGDYLVVVTRPEPALYRIAVADTAASDGEILVTVVFRPER